MDSRITQDVIHFIATERAMDPKEITASSRLYYDLDIIGDDAVELLEAFSRKFRVNLNGFDFHKYFLDEPSLLTPIDLMRRALERLSGKHNPLSPITVGDLIRAAETGKWVEPPGNPSSAG